MNKRDIYSALERLASFFPQKKPEMATLQNYTEMISGYPDTQIKAGFKIILNPKFLIKCGDFFPGPGKILEVFEPVELGETDQANEGSGKIIEAIKLFGSHQSAKAKEHLGEILWVVVERFGGWQMLCLTEERNLGMIRAQLRDMTRAVSARQMQKSQLALINGGLKEIREIKNDY